MSILVLKGDILVTLSRPAVSGRFAHALCLTLQGSQLSSFHLRSRDKIADVEINRLGYIDKRVLVPARSTSG